MTAHSTHAITAELKRTAIMRGNGRVSSISRPFERIPVEILAQILIWTIEDDDSASPDPDRIDIRYYGTYLPTFISDPWSLRNVMRVCSHWRLVALKTPDLWRSVDVYQHVDPLVLCLDRSRNKMVDVSLHRLSGARLALPLLIAHSHRLRKLSIHWPYEDRDDEDECRELTGQVSELYLPVLEELLVDHGEILWPEDLPLDPNLLPSLRIVRFDTHYISWDSKIFTQLRILHLQDVPAPREKDIPLSAFLAILARCQLLEELVLARASFMMGPHLTQEPTHEGQVAGPTVELPKLRLLHLEWDYVWRTPCENYRLLQHLRLRPHTTVRIAADFAPSHDVGDAHSLLDLIPRNPAGLPILTSGISARVFIDPKPPVFIRFAVGSIMESNDFTLLLAKDRAVNPSWPEWYSVDQHLVDFGTLFADAPLTRLSIETEGFSTAGLESSFRLLKHLTTIEVAFKTLGALVELLNALAGLSSLSSSSLPSTSATPPPSSIRSEEAFSDTDDSHIAVVPQLRVLKLQTFPWHSDLLSDIERCLQWRYEHGTELEELYIEAYGRERDTTGEVELQLSHIAQLVALQMRVNGSVVFVDAPLPSPS